MPFYSFRTLGGDTFGSFETYGRPLGPEPDARTQWFWRDCWPGCLPDGPEHGPFASSNEAYEDATGDTLSDDGEFLMGALGAIFGEPRR